MSNPKLEPVNDAEVRRELDAVCAPHGARADLARRLGVSDVYVSNLLNRRAQRVPTRVAELLGYRLVSRWEKKDPTT